MYRELGLLCILFLPVLLIYFSRLNINDQQTKNKKTKKKKNKKKNSTINNKINPIIEDQTKTLRDLEINNEVPTNQHQHSNKTENISQLKLNVTNEKKLQNESNNKKTIEKKQSKNTNNNNNNKNNKLPKSEFPPLTSPQQQNKEREIDEHMDLTPRYSRVMRIKSEEPTETLPPVPQQDGWTSVNTKLSSHSNHSTATMDEPLTKKQRENKARAEKKKQAKATSNAIQEQRLKQHQRQLEKERITEFYSKGPGKNTPWSTNKSSASKKPTAKAGLNEYGQLIWD